MADEVRKILDMLETGKINAEQANKLIAALGTASSKPEPASTSTNGRWLKIRVFETGAQKPKVNVNLPLGLLKILVKFGTKFSGNIPEPVTRELSEKGIHVNFNDMSPEQLEELFSELTKFGPTKLVDVDEGQEHVEITIE